MNNTAQISIIINNYNYGRFLKKAITSVLSQTVLPHEIILVDDGSTDDSLSVADEFKDSIKIVSKKNGGQASAFNAGFLASGGDWIWFLDADDWLEENAVEKVANITNSNLSKVQGKLYAVNEQEELLGFTMPSIPLSSGNVKEEMVKNGGYGWPPTSGNVFPRWVLEECLPMPENEYRLCADLYVCTYAGVLGEVYTTAKPLGFYRIHGNNGFNGFKMNAGWLKNQAINLVMAKSLTEELVNKYSLSKHYQYRYSRKNTEMLLLTYRFSGLRKENVLSQYFLNEEWKNSDEIKSRHGFKLFTAKIYWFILRFAPKTIVDIFMKIAISKAGKFKVNSSA